MYGEDLRKRFPALAPVVDDLFLLEPHQIACLPQRAPRGELAAVLRDYPKLVRFFIAPIAETVFAVEPVTALRAHIRDKAARRGLDNVFVMDGLLSAVPLPAGQSTCC